MPVMAILGHDRHRAASRRLVGFIPDSCRASETMVLVAGFVGKFGHWTLAAGEAIWCQEQPQRVVGRSTVPASSFEPT